MPFRGYIIRKRKEGEIGRKRETKKDIIRGNSDVHVKSKDNADLKGQSPKLVRSEMYTFETLRHPVIVFHRT